jgi:hypothetical protein
MTKGKPWAPEEETKLRDWYKSGVTEPAILSKNFEGKYSKNAVRLKIVDLGLKDNHQEKKNTRCLSSKLNLPAELPSVEEMLKRLVAAINGLDNPGLDKSEVLRFRGIIAGVKSYQELLAEYLDYRGLEAEIAELREKYGVFSKKA